MDHGRKNSFAGSLLCACWQLLWFIHITLYDGVCGW